MDKSTYTTPQCIGCDAGYSPCTGGKPSILLSGKNESATERTSNPVYTGSVAVSGTPDQMSPSRLDISQYIPNPDAGVYELTLSGSRGAKDTTRVLMTGMNLVAKMPQKPEGKPWASEIKAWVLDMHTGDRVGNVFIDAIRPSGKVMASCQTRLDGSCTLGLRGRNRQNAADGADRSERYGPYLS